jgi:pimeloyl-ACP methyl ester carboxylesterase
LTVLAAVAAASAGGLYWFQKVHPVAFRSYVFQPIREITFFLNELDALGRWREIESTRIVEPETFRIPAADAGSVAIAGALYRPAGQEPRGTVILQHGSYPWGRKGALIRLLAKRLSDDGWVAVAPDSRGFGESGTPAEVDKPESWRTAQDLSRTIDYLESTGNVAPGGIFVLGHSMGANQTLEGGLADGRVKALVAVGPGRFPGGIDVSMPEWERARFSADRRLDVYVSRETALFFFALGNIRLLAENELATPDHKPLLLVDGEKEGPAMLAYLSRIVSGLEGPVEYHTLAGAGHYCGVRSFFGSETIYYRPDLFEPFYRIVTTFLSRHSANRPAGQATAERPPALR